MKLVLGLLFGLLLGALLAILLSAQPVSGAAGGRARPAGPRRTPAP